MKLTEFMEKEGLSQRALAKKLGISHTAVSYWLSGKFKVNPANIKKLKELMKTENVEIK